MQKDNDVFMYLSLWDEHGGAPGLGLFRFNKLTGEIIFVEQLNSEISFNCSFIDQTRNILYICNETEALPDVLYRTGRIYGYQLDADIGTIREVFHKETYCPNPSYISMDGTGEYMVVAHHSSYTNVTKIEKDLEGQYKPFLIFNDSVVELFAVNKDGSLGELLDVKKHVPEELVYDRMGRPSNAHPHSAVISPSGKLIAVCDKGDGYIYLYSIDRNKKELVLCGKMLADKLGNAPRYCVFHPKLPYLFVNYEHAHDRKMNIGAFRYDEEGKLEKIEVINLLSEKHIIPDGSNYEQQGFCIHPSGKYLYSILNGLNVVAVIEVDEETGRMVHIQTITIEGEWPRGIAIAPEGKYLVTSCLASGHIAVYAIGIDGKLTLTGFKAHLRGGSYITFYD